MTHEVFIGADIGGGSTKLGLVTRDGAIVARRRLTYPPGASGESILSDYITAIEALMRDRNVAELGGIGIGFPGHVLPDRDRGTNSNVPALDEKRITGALKGWFSCPVGLLNDADAGAVAEYRFGAGRGAERLLLITVGTGVGVSFVVDGVPMNTANGCLGDAGHLVIVATNPVRCRQGCLGCLESVASGDAIERRAASLFPPQGDASATATLIGAALAGDARAAEIIAEAGRWIGMAAAGWCNLFAPHTVLIGGGISAAGALLVDAISEEACRRGMPFNIERVTFRLARLGNDAGIIGAAAEVMF